MFFLFRVKLRPRIFFSLCACFCLPVHAHDLADYRVGDLAEADIITPMALDVPDSAATAALQSAKATQFPAVFRVLPGATNVIAADFLATFGQARTNFLAAVSAEFHAPKLDEATVASPDFGRLVTAFGVQNKNFPVPDELAAEWARGGEGVAICGQLLTALQRAEGRFIRPDALPNGMIIGETVRVVPVAEPDQKLSLEAVEQGTLIPAAALTTLSNAQAEFRRGFPAGQQLFARELANFVKPNCLPDAPFTQLTRGTAVCQLVVATHFDSGDTIARHGDIIDAKALAAITALNEKLSAAPPQNPPPVVVKAEPPPRPAATPPPIARQNPPINPPAPTAPTQPVRRHENLIFGLTGVSVAALLVAGWQFHREKRRAAGAAAIQAPLPFPGALKNDLTPQVTQAVREAVQQELAQQRRELLLAQQAATDEIAALVQRLDELQVPMQERLHAYETRIRELETELAVRNEENRELLRLKIETTRRQMETEHATTLMTATAA